MTINEIETRIRAAVEAQRAKGVRIGTSQFVASKACMCPLGCLLAEIEGGMPDENDRGYVGRVEEELAVGGGWAWAFVEGFDFGRVEGPGHPEARALGAKLRAEYVDGESP